MPIRIQKRRMKKKRFYKKKRTYRNRSYPMVLGGFPKSKLVKLRYVQELRLDVIAPGPYARRVFSANSCYDPDVTGTGHQPSNFDRWIDQYKNFTVLGSKLTAQYVPTSLTSVVPGLVGCILSTDGTTVPAMSGLQDLLEQPNNSRGRQLTAGRDIANPFTKVVQTFSASKFFGKNKANVIGDDQLAGTVSTNPVERAYYELYMYTLNNNDPGPCTFIVTIDYVVLFHDRLQTLDS